MQEALQYIDFTRDYSRALAECRKSVTILLGTVSVNSTPDQAEIANQPQVSPQPLSGKTGSVTQALDATRILWVDDRPNNNMYERAMMEKLGATFALATDTGEALRAIGQWAFDLIISDMGRPSGPTAGYDLLAAIRQQGKTLPFVIYAGSNSQALKDEAVLRGAQGSTNDPRELLELIFAALKRVPK